MTEYVKECVDHFRIMSRSRDFKQMDDNNC